MNILFITAYPLEYNTSGNVRNMGLINGLVENGHSVSTLSSYPTDDSLFTGEIMQFPFSKRYWIGSKSKSITLESKNKWLEKLKGVVYKWNNSLSVYDRRRFLVKDIKHGLVDEKFDVIISSSDPKSAHLFAEKLISLDKSICRKWIQYWGDPFSNDISTKHSFSEKRVAKEEKRLIKLADKIVYVSPFTASELSKKYNDYKEKISFLPIPFIRKIKSDKPNNAKKGKLVVYLGDYFSSNRNIMNLVDVLKTEGIDSAIVGNSDLQIPSTNEVIVKKRLIGPNFDTIINNVAVYTCVCNLHGSQIPGKLYHYVDTGKPILVVLDGDNQDELKKYIESFDRFYICYNTKESISKTLQTIFEEDKTFTTPQQLDPRFIAEEFLR